MQLNDYIGEATAYDKKLMLERKDPTSWLKSVSAFASTQGGRLLFGVANDGTLAGLADAQGDSEFIGETIKVQMDPVPEIELSLHEEDDKRFVVVEIKAGSETPYYTFVKGHRDAFIHRDYLELGSEVHVDIYDDRMEITSPGGMPSGRCAQELDAYMFASERLGQHVAPSFVSDPTGFVATLPNLHYVALHSNLAGFADAMASSAKSDAKSGATRQGRTAGKNENVIYRTIRGNPHVSIAELQRKTKLSNGGVRKILAVLKSKGMIIRVGGTNGGHWEVVK